MVDIARIIPQAASAQLAGAGLGGCMMVLAHASTLDTLVEKLTRRYYMPLAQAWHLGLRTDGGQRALVA